MMLSENVKPENNILNKVFCESEDNLVGFLVYHNFRLAVPDITRELPFAKAVTLRFERTFRLYLAAVEVLIKEPMDPVSIIA